MRAIGVRVHCAACKVVLVCQDASSEAWHRNIYYRKKAEQRIRRLVDVDVVVYDLGEGRRPRDALVLLVLLVEVRARLGVEPSPLSSSSNRISSRRRRRRCRRRPSRRSRPAWRLRVALDDDDRVGPALWTPTPRACTPSSSTPWRKHSARRRASLRTFVRNSASTGPSSTNKSLMTQRAFDTGDGAAAPAACPRTCSRPGPS